MARLKKRIERPTISPMTTGLHPVRPVGGRRTHRKMVRTEVAKERRRHKK